MSSPGQKESPRKALRAALNAWLVCVTITVMALVISSCNGNGGTDRTQSGGGQSTPLGDAAVYSFLAATGAQVTEGNTFFQGSVVQLTNLLTARCMTSLGFGSADEPLIQYDDKYLDVASPVAPGFRSSDSAGVPGLYNMRLLSAKGSLMSPILIGAPQPPNNLPLPVQQAITTDYFRCQRHARAPFMQLDNDGDALKELWRTEVASIEGIRSGPNGDRGLRDMHTPLWRSGVGWLVGRGLRALAAFEGVASRVSVRQDRTD